MTFCFIFCQNVSTNLVVFLFCFVFKCVKRYALMLGAQVWNKPFLYNFDPFLFCMKHKWLVIQQILKTVFDLVCPYIMINKQTKNKKTLCRRKWQHCIQLHMGRRGATTLYGEGGGLQLHMGWEGPTIPYGEGGRGAFVLLAGYYPCKSTFR